MLQIKNAQVGFKTEKETFDQIMHHKDPRVPEPDEKTSTPWVSSSNT